MRYGEVFVDRVSEVKWSYGEVLVDKSAIDLILRVLDNTVTISFGCILYCLFVFTCTVLVVYCFVMCVCVCVCVCVCGFCNVCVLVICILSLLGYPEFFPCFFLL